MLPQHLGDVNAVLTVLMSAEPTVFPTACLDRGSGGLSGHLKGNCRQTLLALLTGGIADSDISTIARFLSVLGQTLLVLLTAGIANSDIFTIARFLSVLERLVAFLLIPSCLMIRLNQTKQV